MLKKRTAPIDALKTKSAMSAENDPRIEKRTQLPRRAKPRTPSYLTGGPKGWRFQMRLPISLSVCGFKTSEKPIVKKFLGPGSTRSAQAKAETLAFIVRSVCQFVEFSLSEFQGSLGGDEVDDGCDLLSRIVDACKAVIDRALADPTYAVTFANSLQISLDALTGVAGVMQNPYANPALRIVALQVVVDALNKVISSAGTTTGTATFRNDNSQSEPFKPKVSQQPLTMPDRTAVPAPTSLTTWPPEKIKAKPQPPRSPPRSTDDEGNDMTFRRVSDGYIAMRRETGSDMATINALTRFAGSFLDVIGDRPIHEYKPVDLQTYVNQMQYMPKNASKIAKLKGLGTLSLINTNKKFKYEPIARNTLQNGFVASIRAMINYGAQTSRITNPFAGFNLRYPAMLRAPVHREEISANTMSQIFADGIRRMTLHLALLPLLGLLTSRRLGLLVYLQGSDIRQKDGIWIAQVGNIACKGGVWSRVPTKTDASLTYFVLHDFLAEIGFVQWASEQDGWVFAQLHQAVDPVDTASKAMSRLFRGNGAKGENREVFHSLRHMAIDETREVKVSTRDQKLQSGHAIGSDERERYGARSIKTRSAKMLSSAPLPEGIDFSVFQGVDFDALAKGSRRRGRTGHQKMQDK